MPLAGHVTAMDEILTSAGVRTAKVPGKLAKVAVEATSVVELTELFPAWVLMV